MMGNGQDGYDYQNVKSSSKTFLAFFFGRQFVRRVALEKVDQTDKKQIRVDELHFEPRTINTSASANTLGF